MFRIIGLLVALLSCLATLTWAQGTLTLPGAATVAPAAGSPPASDTKGRKASAPVPAGNGAAGATNKSLVESRSNVAPDPAARKPFNESRPNVAPDSAAKKTFNESRSNALRTGEPAPPAAK